MPFVPLTPEESARFPKPCRHPQHDPPSMIVIKEPVKWVCPACGHSVIINPRRATLRSQAAADLGRLGGLKGGVARAAKLPAERRKEIAIKAAQARWNRRSDREESEET